MLCDTCGLKFTDKGLKYHKNRCIGLEKVNEALKLLSEGVSKRDIIKLGYPRSLLFTTLKGRNTPSVPSNIKNERIFETIDTKEKAYWLGFLYADGFIGKNKRFLRLNLSVKDEEQLDRFIDFVGGTKEDKRKSKEYYNGDKLRSGKMVYFCILSKKIVLDLEDNGCVYKKSSIIRLPEFYLEELDLAFLLGYYDGNGDATKTSFSSGSIGFIEDVKIKYKLNSSIVTKGGCHRFYFGTELFDKMIKNYENSMPRKRFLFYRVSDLRKMRSHNNNLCIKILSTCENCMGEIGYQAKLCKNCYKISIRKVKNRPTKEILIASIEKSGYEATGKIYGVSGNAIRKWMR